MPKKPTESASGRAVVAVIEVSWSCDDLVLTDIAAMTDYVLGTLATKGANVNLARFELIDMP